MLVNFMRPLRDNRKISKLNQLISAKKNALKQLAEKNRKSSQSENEYLFFLIFAKLA